MSAKATVTHVDLHGGVTAVSIEGSISYVDAKANAFFDVRGLFQLFQENLTATDVYSRVWIAQRDFTENVTATELIARDIARPFEESLAGVTDGVSLATGRFVTDSTSATDAAPTFVVTLRPSEFINTTEVVVAAVNYFLTDDITVSDLFEPVLGIGVGFDTATTSDDLYFGFGVNPADTATATHITAFDVGAVAVDTATITDVALVDYQIGVLPTDTVATSGVFGYTSTRVTSSVLNANTLGSFGLNV
mgnify:CR=1 FL=1